MDKKCLFCKCNIPEDSVIDFCIKCGVGVWGEKMFSTIVQNMERAREKGDLCTTNTSPETTGLRTFESKF